MSTTPVAGLSRRALFGIGGSTLLAATAFAAWRGRTWSVGAPTGRSKASIAYADHDGWMVALAEKRALQARPAEAPGVTP
jgi:hypothetical protein